VSELTAADDGFHQPATDDPWWTETAWFSAEVPERELSLTIYPVFRPNLGVAALTVAVWDATAVSSWEIPYFRSLWHLALPASDLTSLDLAGLRYRTIEPLHAYEVTYHDGERVALELRYDGLREPHAPHAGHLDQSCRVTGTITLGGERIDVDGFAMRDRSWGPRPDDRTTVASYSYGIASTGDEWLAIGFLAGASYQLVAGYLVRDGEKAALTGGERRVVERATGYPVAIEIDATDALGRRLEARGRCTNRFAKQATPGMFAWMSQTEWQWSGLTAHGEDQDIWSPNRLPDLPA
jgi:hypothetical protein